MLRISEILKKYKEEQKKSGTEGIRPEPAKAEETIERKPQISISSVVSKEIEKISSTNAGKLYDEALSKAKQIYRPDLDYEPGFMPGISALVEKIVDSSSAGNRELLRLCLTDYAKFEDYLYCHVVNVCIISLEIGLGLGYERSRLIELGISAFIHDLGIIRYLDIINKTRILNNEEYNKIKEHPNTGLEILSKINQELKSLSIFDAVCQEHERMDGSGYPKGLKGNEITEYAQIIGLVDVYEAMLHQRPYRSKYTPLETIKTILNNKSAFRAELIKILIEGVGIFPLGTPVRLNTKEIGQVLKENPELPLRPVVNIILDAQGKELKQPKQIDLADNPVIYIEDCLKEVS